MVLESCKSAQAKKIVPSFAEACQVERVTIGRTEAATAWPRNVSRTSNLYHCEVEELIYPLIVRTAFVSVQTDIYSS